MSQLIYMTPRGAGACRMGPAATLGPAMLKLRRPAKLWSEHRALIGESRACDLSCDGQCRGWHVWYDPTGDDMRPEPDLEEETDS